MLPVVVPRLSVPPDETEIPLARVIPVPASKVALPVEFKLLFNVIPMLEVKLVVPVAVIPGVPPFNIRFPPSVVMA